MKTRRLISFAVLALTGAASAISLPANVSGTQRVDLNSHIALRNTLNLYASRVGGRCPSPSGFHYSVPADATAGVNAWLQGQGLTATTLEQSSSSVVWVAKSASSGDQVLGMYSADGQGGGYLLLCDATSAAAQYTGNTSDASDTSSSVHVSGRGLGKLIGLGLMGLFGIGGAVANAFRRMTGGGEEA
jgi:hypothetical protein